LTNNDSTNGNDDGTNSGTYCDGQISADDKEEDNLTAADNDMMSSDNDQHKDGMMTQEDSKVPPDAYEAMPTDHLIQTTAPVNDDEHATRSAALSDNAIVTNTGIDRKDDAATTLVTNGTVNNETPSNITLQRHQAPMHASITINKDKNNKLVRTDDNMTTNNDITMNVNASSFAIGLQAKETLSFFQNFEFSCSGSGSIRRCHTFRT